MVTGSVRGGACLCVYGGSRPQLISKAWRCNHGEFPSFGPKLVETSCPTPHCQVVIPYQVFGFHSCKREECVQRAGQPIGPGRPPWTPAMEKVCMGQGGRLVGSTHPPECWQEQASSLFGQQRKGHCLFGNSSTGTHMCGPSYCWLDSCRGGVTMETLCPSHEGPENMASREMTAKPQKRIKERTKPLTRSQ